MEEERALADITIRCRRRLMKRVLAALQDTVAEVEKEVGLANLSLPAPSLGYFTAIVHQQMFCKLCGADPETFSGGNAETASIVISKGRNIAEQYWGAGQP